MVVSPLGGGGGWVAVLREAGLYTGGGVVNHQAKQPPQLHPDTFASLSAESTVFSLMSS